MRADLLFLAALLIPAFAAPALRADERVRAQLLALYDRFDADSDGQLSSEEQETALEWVEQRHGEAWRQRVRGLFGSLRDEEGAIAAARFRREVEAYGAAPTAPAEVAASSAPRTERVAMSDGTRLATDVYLPEGEGPFATVLLRTPYGRSNRQRQVPGFLRRGFAVVAQDMRGRFDSEGENLPFVGCGWNEHEDGADTVAWIREQAWSDGQVASFGGSAGGITQNFLAAAGPEGLVAQYIVVADGSLYRASRIGGALREADVTSWSISNRFDPEALEETRRRTDYDDYWRDLDSSLRSEYKDVPAVHVGGWFDVFAQGTVEEFLERQHRGGPGSRGRQKLVMGPWAHAIGRMPVGELSFPDSAPTGGLDPLAWFEHWLLGVENGVDSHPAVTYYTMGSLDDPAAPGNEWRQADDWPPAPAEIRAYAFSADGSLANGPAAASPDGRVDYTFDPADPVPTVGGQNLTLPSGPRDQREVEARDDVLVFTTEALAEPVEVTGTPTVRLRLSSSAVDTDLSVRLSDVYPDGRSLLITEGMLRLRYRNSLAEPEPLVPGEPVEVEIPLWDTSIVFNRGHRIRLAVTSSNHPRFDLNPGTGIPWSEGGETVAQHNTLHLGGESPSQLILPVIVAE